MTHHIEHSILLKSILFVNVLSWRSSVFRLLSHDVVQFSSKGINRYGKTRKSVCYRRYVSFLRSLDRRAGASTDPTFSTDLQFCHLLSLIIPIANATREKNYDYPGIAYIDLNYKIGHSQTWSGRCGAISSVLFKALFFVIMKFIGMI